MSVITAIFEAIGKFFASVLLIIFAVLFSVVIGIYTLFYSVFGDIRPRYEITDDFLMNQGVEDIQFIGSEFEVTGDYERTYSGVTREKYNEYCEYLFDYISSKRYQMYLFGGKEQPLPFPRFYMYHFSPCDNLESLFSDDGCEFGLYYTYGDGMRGIKVSYADGDVTVAFRKPSGLDIYSDPSEVDIDEPVPEG